MLESDVVKLQSDNKILTDNVDKLRLSIDVVNKQIEANKVSEDKLKTAAAEDKKIIDNLQSDINNINEYNRELQIKSVEYRKQLEDSLSKNEELVNNLEILNKQFSSSKDKIRYLTNIIVDYENIMNSIDKYNSKYIRKSGK